MVKERNNNYFISDYLFRLFKNYHLHKTQGQAYVRQQVKPFKCRAYERMSVMCDGQVKKNSLTTETLLIIYNYK